MVPRKYLGRPLITVVVYTPPHLHCTRNFQCTLFFKVFALLCFSSSVFHCAASVLPLFTLPRIFLPLPIFLYSPPIFLPLFVRNLLSFIPDHPSFIHPCSSFLHLSPIIHHQFPFVFLEKKTQKQPGTERKNTVLRVVKRKTVFRVLQKKIVPRQLILSVWEIWAFIALVPE